MGASELGARCGHSGLLRQYEPRVDPEVHRAPGGRSPDTPPDPEMVEGGRFGRRSVVGDEAGHVAGSSCFTSAVERLRICAGGDRRGSSLPRQQFILTYNGLIMLIAH